MTRITYTRETLLSLNTPNSRVPANLPPELVVTRPPTTGTLFNPRVSCRPSEIKRGPNTDLDPDAAGILIY